MKFNPISKTLLTDRNVLIKQLSCPYGVTWSELSATVMKNNKCCSLCMKNIIDIRNMRDEDVVRAVKQDPSICLKVDINDANIRVVNHNG